MLESYSKKAPMFGASLLIHSFACPVATLSKVEVRGTEVPSKPPVFPASVEKED